MLLERIRLRAFGCFQEQDFDLHDGINLIFGPNFSGEKHTRQRDLLYTDREANCSTRGCFSHKECESL